MVLSCNEGRRLGTIDLVCIPTQIEGVLSTATSARRSLHTSYCSQLAAGHVSAMDGSVGIDVCRGVIFIITCELREMGCGWVLRVAARTARRGLDGGRVSGS